MFLKHFLKAVVCPSPYLPKMTGIWFIWTELGTRPHMPGLLCIVNFIYEDGILYRVKQFILLAFIVLIFFFKVKLLFLDCNNAFYSY